MDMADLIAEVKAIKAKVKELEDKPGGADTGKIEALEKKIEALDKKLSKPLEDSDFDPWE